MRPLRSLAFALVLAGAASSPAGALAAPQDTTLVSLGQAGQPGGSQSLGGDSQAPSISADGRYVAFASNADNLLPGVSAAQIYVRDLRAGALTLASRGDGPNGAPIPNRLPSLSSLGGAISGNGRYVVFGAAGAGVVAGVDGYQVYVRDLRRGRTILASRADGADGHPAEHATAGWISADGRYVAFTAAATTPEHELVPGVHSEVGRGVYMRDLWTGRTILVGRADGPDGTPFSGWATTGIVGISPGGRYVTMIVSGESVSDPRLIYLRDVRLGRTLLVSRADGASGAPAAKAWATQAPITADGCRVAFAATGGGLVPGVASTGTQAYVRDLCEHTTRLVSQADGLDGGPAMSPPYPETSGLDSYVYVNGQSADGRYVAFASVSPNFASLPPDNEVRHQYVRDTVGGRTILVSRASGPSGAPGGQSDRPFATTIGITPDARYVPFSSGAANLLPPPFAPAGFGQVYLRDLGDQPPGTPIEAPLDDPGLGTAEKPPWADAPDVDDPPEESPPANGPDDREPPRGPDGTRGPTFAPPPRKAAAIAAVRVNRRRVRLRLTRAARVLLEVRRATLPTAGDRKRAVRWRTIVRRTVAVRRAGRVVALALPQLRPGRYRFVVAIANRPSTRVTRSLRVAATRGRRGAAG